MKKKILALLLGAVIFFAALSPALALDIGDLTDKLKENKIIAGILNDPQAMEIISEITTSDGFADILEKILKIAPKLNKEYLSQFSKEELYKAARYAARVIADWLNKLSKNKDLLIPYKPDNVIKNLLGNDKGPLSRNRKLVKGDVDGDGRITAADARLVLRYSAKLVDLTAEQAKRADMDGDGVVTAKDARVLLRMSAGLV